jgi:hypothetical protein
VIPLPAVASVLPLLGLNILGASDSGSTGPDDIMLLPATLTGAS